MYSVRIMESEDMKEMAKQIQTKNKDLNNDIKKMNELFKAKNDEINRL